MSSNLFATIVQADVLFKILITTFLRQKGMQLSDFSSLSQWECSVLICTCASDGTQEERPYLLQV